MAEHVRSLYVLPLDFDRRNDLRTDIHDPSRAARNILLPRDRGDDDLSRAQVITQAAMYGPPRRTSTLALRRPSPGADRLYTCNASHTFVADAADRYSAGAAALRLVLEPI
jgi:hypothetical protein